MPEDAEEIYDAKKEADILGKVLLPFLLLGFKKGIDQGLSQGDGTTKPEDIFTTAVQEAIRQQAYEHAALAAGTTADQIQALISSAVEEGWSVPDFARKLESQFNVDSRVRSLRIARTELTGTINDGTNKTLLKEGHQQKEWSTVIDGRERESHAEADGQVVGIHDFFRVGGSSCAFPGDDMLPASESINCFLPGTIVRGRVNLAIRSFYAGQAIEIVCSNGNVLRVTENHPILTKAGFVPACSLNEGDELLNYIGDVHLGRSPAGSLPSYEYHKPTAIEEIFRSLSSVGFRELRRIGSSDFHGDGQFSQGDVEIVGAYGELLENKNASRFKDRSNAIFKGELTKLLPKDGKGSLILGGGRVLTSPSCFPTSGTLPLDCGSISFEDSPLQTFSFGTSPDVNASLFQNTPDGSSGNPKLFSHLLFRHPRLIQTDRIISLRRFEFSGHVYDVQAPCGWIVAQNIVTSNCRCVIVAANLPDNRRQQIGEAFLRVHGALERRLVLSLRSYFEGMKRRVLSQFPT